MARLLPVSRRQGRQQQVPVALLTGGAGFGIPDRVQDGQVVGVGHSLLPGLGRGQLLPVPLQHVSQDSQRVPGAGGCCGRVRSGGRRGGVLVVAGQFGSRARAGRRVGELGRQGEHVDGVGVSAAGQGDVGVLAVLGAGDHRQAGVHGAALRGMVSDRIAQLSSFVACEQEVPVGPAAPSGFRVRIERPANEQPIVGDVVDAQQVAVGQGPAGFPGLHPWSLRVHTIRSPGLAVPVGDAHGRPGPDDSEADQVIADAAGQFPAQCVVGGHQQGVGAVHGERDVGGRGGIHHRSGSPPWILPCWSYSASTEASPARSRRLAACSQAARNRTGSASWT